MEAIPWQGAHQYVSLIACYPPLYPSSSTDRGLSSHTHKLTGSLDMTMHQCQTRSHQPGITNTIHVMIVQSFNRIPNRTVGLFKIFEQRQRCCPSSIQPAQQPSLGMRGEARLLHIYNARTVQFDRMRQPVQPQHPFRRRCIRKYLSRVLRWQPLEVTQYSSRQQHRSLGLVRLHPKVDKEGCRPSTHQFTLARGHQGNDTTDR